MPKRATRLVAGLIAASLSVALSPAAQAAPTCPDPVTRPACGGRIIPNAIGSGTFIQYHSEYKPVLAALEALAPGIIEVDELGDMVGRPELTSFGGREMPIVTITDESVTDPKKQVAISLSVHGNESAGREGGLRYVEDLARWWNDDKDHLLYAGDVGIPLSGVLAQTEIYIGIINVDGWADGDIDAQKWAAGGRPGLFKRGNDAGADLNRDYPTTGWTKQNQLIHPETQGWTALVGSLPNLTTATDIHGELTSANDAFSDIMYPAGQWDADRLAQEEQFAVNMNRTVERKFAEEGVILQTAFDLAGDDRPMKPANFATAYDVVGYDDSGFMGDWFASQGAVELDVENFLSHLVPSNAWAPLLEQAHIAAVKGNMEATIAEAVITDDVESSLALGDIAYVFDPVRISRPAGEDENAYDASRMDYFDELRASTGATVTKLNTADLATADLAAYDSIVLADVAVPTDAEGRTVDRGAYVAALDAFVRDGGQLVLTDGAINFLVDLGLFTEDEVDFSRWQAGHVDFGDRNHRWEQDLTGVPSQTFYAVPLGYRSSSSIREAPHWGIDSAAWAAKGGVAAGTIGDDADTVNLGELPHGDGSIAIFGAILPTQQPASGMASVNRIQWGLADYAMSVAGGTVLHSILGFERGEVVATEVAYSPEPTMAGRGTAGLHGR